MLSWARLLAAAALRVGLLLPEEVRRNTLQHCLEEGHCCSTRRQVVDNWMQGEDSLEPEHSPPVDNWVVFHIEEEEHFRSSLTEGGWGSIPLEVVDSQLERAAGGLRLAVPT